MKYIAIDGDHVGARLEKYLLENDERELATFSQDLSSLLDELAEKLKREGYSIVYLGGDSLLAKKPDFDLELVADEVQNTKITFSVGIGTSCHDAYIALKYAKASGRNRFVEYQDKTFSVLAKDLS